MTDNELDCDQPEFWLRQAESDLIIARGVYVAAADAARRRADGGFVTARRGLKIKKCRRPCACFTRNRRRKRR